MSRTFLGLATKNKNERRLFEQERAIVEITELILEIMEEAGVSRSELAKQVGKSKSYITQILDGSANMTVRTMSDLLFALGRRLRFSDEGPNETREFRRQLDSRESALFSNKDLWEQVCHWRVCAPLSQQATADVELAG